MDSYSKASEPTCSIIQGRRSGTRFARILTYYVMDKVCTAHVRCSHRVWIDDMSQSTKGSQQQ
eukprot:2794296-Pyramimonas_sp.AAC.1